MIDLTRRPDASQKPAGNSDRGAEKDVAGKVVWIGLSEEAAHRTWTPVSYYTAVHFQGLEGNTRIWHSLLRADGTGWASGGDAQIGGSPPPAAS
jgi:hypothetical protein